MTIKGTEILNKVMGSGLLLASVAFFTEISHAPENMIPGVLFGAGGFFLALRRDRRASAELEGQQRLDQLTEGLAAAQAELAALQERLDRLTDERDFMRQLGTSSGAPARAPADVALPAAGAAGAGVTADAASHR